MAMRNAVIGLLLVWNGLAFAGEPPAPPQAQQRQDGQQKQQEEYWKQMQQQYEKTQQEELERLKKMDPKLYEQRQRDLQRQTKINAILQEFHQGKLTDAQCESQLFPLIKEELGPEISGLEARIQRLEKQLAFTRSAKQNPDLLIKKRIGQMLGRPMAGPEEMMGW
jgi:hypothetical protein